MNHTQLLNYLADKYKLKAYLEIGVQSTKQNFDKINCKYKIGVDPDCKGYSIHTGTSDSFFSQHNLKSTFDLIFIDGLHHADQVKRDFENSLRCLDDGGFIVIHDCLPEEEKTSLVPRESKQWHGDVYKFVMTLKNYDGIDFITYDFDNGCCVVWKDKTKKANSDFHVPFNWQSYKAVGKELMNVQNEPVRI